MGGIALLGRKETIVDNHTTLAVTPVLPDKLRFHKRLLWLFQATVTKGVRHGKFNIVIGAKKSCRTWQ
jgi:hypothetical protein